MWETPPRPRRGGAGFVAQFAGGLAGLPFVAMSREVATPRGVGRSSPHLGLATRASYARLRLRRVVCLRYADNVAFRVGELSEDHHAGDFSDRHDRLPTLRLDLVEVGLRIVDLNVEGDLIAAAISSADAAADALASVVDHAVVHRVIGVDLPAEDARVEVLKILSVLPRDIEPCDWVCHFDFLLFRTDGRFSRLNYNVSVEADNRLSVVLRKRDNFARARDPLGASVTTARGF